MKIVAGSVQSHPFSDTRILTSVLAFVLSAHGASLAQSAETIHEPHSGSSSLSANTQSSNPLSDSIPQGIAKPIQRATMSAPLPGVLVQLLVTGGDSVKKGQILAVMDNRIATSAVDVAEVAAKRSAAIQHAEHSLALARSLFARQRKLQDAQAGADFELEQARVQRAQAEAKLASAMEEQLQAQRNLELEKARLESHNLRAPFDGTVVLVDATVGTTFAPSDKFLTIINLDSLEAELFLPLELFNQLQNGRFYRLWAFAPVNRWIQARLTFASPTIDSASRTFRCMFKIDNQDRQLPTGFGVRFDSSSDHSNRDNTP